MKTSDIKYTGFIPAVLIALLMVSGCGIDTFFSNKFNEAIDPPEKEVIPTAVIADSNRKVLVGSTVILDGTYSYDPQDESLTFAWVLAEIPNGSTATISSSTNAVVSFVADKGGTYVVTLQVTNQSGKISNIATAYIDATSNLDNHPPVAIAGADQSATLGDVVVLDGSASFDEDGDTIQYSWAVVGAPSGSSYQLDGRGSSQAFLTPDIVGTYTVRLWVSDGTDSDEDITVITVSKATT